MFGRILEGTFLVLFVNGPVVLLTVFIFILVSDDACGPSVVQLFGFRFNFKEMFLQVCTSMASF
jgi:hypothetical protein